MKGVQTTAGSLAPHGFLGVHHHLIFPIDTVAVRPATRRRSGGRSEAVIARGDLGFSPPPGIKAEFQ